jgi:hypothetical protein
LAGRVLLKIIYVLVRRLLSLAVLILRCDPAAAPIIARSAHVAMVPAMISHAAGLPRLSVQPAPKRAPITRAGSSRLT